MGKTNLGEAYLFKISIKMRFFWRNYWCENSIVTIEPGRILLQFVTTNCLVLNINIHENKYACYMGFDKVNHLNIILNEIQFEENNKSRIIKGSI